MENDKPKYSPKYIPYFLSGEQSKKELPKMTGRWSRELKIFFKENHDHCTECHSHFRIGELTHLGYNYSNEFIYACNKCATHVQETVVRYGYSQRAYSLPKKDSFLWRYMDFTKYVSLLHTKALYFCSASLFNDSFEGAKGTADNKDIYGKGYIAALADAIADMPEAKEIIKPTEKDFAKARELHEQMARAKLEQRNFTFLNCWHENEVESDAMWYLYSKDISNAIAIRTTYKKFYLALDRDPDIDIGRVNYIDYNKEFTQTNAEFWYKRVSFSHEREVRAVTRDRSEPFKPGIYQKVNLDILIDRVYISPKADEWFVELVEDINSRYGIKKQVFHSDLSKKPFY